MSLKKTKVVTTQGYGRSKDQRGVKSIKEVEYGIDISGINLSNFTFHGRFVDERMNVQFVHIFWAKAKIEA